MLTERRGVDVLRREQEEVDPDTRLDTFLRRDSIEGILRHEEGLLLVGPVQLAVFTMLERPESDRRQRSLEDVELAAEGFLRGGPR